MRCARAGALRPADAWFRACAFPTTSFSPSIAGISGGLIRQAKIMRAARFSSSIGPKGLG